MSAPPVSRHDGALVWFRRDLRPQDHVALAHALLAHRRVYCAFVFDADILGRLKGNALRRLSFVHGALLELDSALRRLGGGLLTVRGRAHEAVPRLARELGVAVVYANRDYEPAAIARDETTAQALRDLGIAFVTHKDQVIFERDEVLTRQRAPFAVFTPYKRAWLAKLQDADLQARSFERYTSRLAAVPAAQMPALDELGVQPDHALPAGVAAGATVARRLLADFAERIDQYHVQRDFPGVKGPSYLSVHLRFGTLSIREAARLARSRSSEGASTWLSELIWRDFYFMILAHHPHVVEHAFRPEYDAIDWEDDAPRFAAWCEGRTGYPIVDAAMRQMNQSGYMHNRLRMIVASFLTKDLGIDWRQGERYFAEQLIDYDLAANNGGWQWAASTGCDAQPYFRIFNPVTQSERFDPQGKFIRRYVPELIAVPEAHVHAPWTLRPVDQAALGCVIGRDYPAPIVDHAQARVRSLERFGRVKRRD